MNKKTFTVKEFCKEYGIGLNKGYELVNMTGFPKIKLGRKIIVIRDKVDEWLNSNIGLTI